MTLQCPWTRDGQNIAPPRDDDQSVRGCLIPRDRKKPRAKITQSEMADGSDTATLISLD